MGRCRGVGGTRGCDVLTSERADGRAAPAPKPRHSTVGCMSVNPTPLPVRGRPQSKAARAPLRRASCRAARCGPSCPGRCPPRRCSSPPPGRGGVIKTRSEVLAFSGGGRDKETGVAGAAAACASGRVPNAKAGGRRRRRRGGRPHLLALLAVGLDDGVLEQGDGLEGEGRGRAVRCVRCGAAFQDGHTPTAALSRQTDQPRQMRPPHTLSRGITPDSAKNAACMTMLVRRPRPTSLATLVASMQYSWGREEGRVCVFVVGCACVFVCVCACINL